MDLNFDVLEDDELDAFDLLQLFMEYREIYMCVLIILKNMTN